jgi:plasmid replication initiation protein
MKPLLPIRHAQTDLFICDLFDTWKDDMGSMEHPVFSLSTKPDYRTRKYEHNGNIVEIFPASQGLATIHDKDVLLYLASQIMHELNQRQKQGEREEAQDIEAPPQTVLFTAYDLLVLTNRTTSKLGYQRLESALQRLSGTRIQTNIKTNNIRITKNFGILDSFSIIREDIDNPKSRMIGVEVKLSDWFYNSLLGHEVLSISPDYFRLRMPLERRIYELARKHCGNQSKPISIGLETLQKKTGSNASKREFRRSINKIINGDHMPDYQIYFDEDKKDMLIMRPRHATKTPLPQSSIYLKPKTFETAENILSKHGLDKYAVEAEWREWIEDKEPPKTPDGAFIGFCKFKVDSL